MPKRNTVEVIIRGENQAAPALAQVTKELGSLGREAEHTGGLFSGFGRTMGGLVDGLGRFGLAALGVKAAAEGIAGAVNGFLQGAIEAESVMAQTNATLKSTKGAAGMSAEAITDLASSLSRLTPFEDEAIQGAENLLLTFTSVGKDVFPEATEVILDMSQALGQDLKSSAIQLGKALQDPKNGITALRRVGVNFNDAQKEMIEKMVDAGDLMGAQRMILKELQTEFGGAAKAAGQTFAGKLAILNTQVGNVKEAIGGALLPVLSGLLDKVTPLIVGFGEKLPGALAVLSGLFDDLFGEGGNLGTFMDDIRELTGLDISPFVEPLVEMFLGLKDAIGGALAGDWSKAWEGLRASGTVVLSILSDLLGQVWAWIKAQAPVWLAQLQVWGQALVDWIAPMIPPVLAKLDELAVSLWAWIKAQAPVWLAQLQVWGQALVDWIAPMIPPVLAKLDELAVSLWTWIKAQAAVLLDRFGAWASAFVEWVVPATVKFLAEWPKMLDQFLDWIAKQAEPILVKLGEWALAFVKWIAPMIPPFLLALAGISLTIATFVIETVAVLAGKLLQWAAAFVAWVAPLIPPLLSELVKLLGQLVTWLVETGLPALVAQLGKWAQAFWDWVGPQIPVLLAELAKLLGAVVDWLVNTALPDFVAKGKELGSGLIKGIYNAIRGVTIYLPSFNVKWARHETLGQEWWTPEGFSLTSTALRLADVLPELAAGVRDFRGGLALVGERGPELVTLPRGADVYSASQTRGLMGNRTQVNHQTVILTDRGATVAWLAAQREARLQAIGAGF